MLRATDTYRGVPALKRTHGLDSPLRLCYASAVYGTLTKTEKEDSIRGT